MNNPKNSTDYQDDPVNEQKDLSLQATSKASCQNKRVLTGIQPSGQLHIGNYFGAIKPMIEMMNTQGNECFCFIADYHALTTIHDAKKLQANIQNAILDWMACGLDPEKITFYVQSDLPEVQELAWILHTVTPLGLLQRANSYKEKIAAGLPASSGLLTYPVLMAADILIMQTDVVPAGKDQKQHIEMSRDIAKSFNSTYGKAFKLPKEKIAQEVAVVPGIDGRKMSKSYDNVIPLFAQEQQIRKQVMLIMTDSKRVEEPKDPDSCNIVALYRLVASPDQQEILAARYQSGGLAYGDAKSMLFESIRDYFAPIWQKRKELEQQKGFIEEVRTTGKKKAKNVAVETLEKVRKLVGLA